MTDRELKGKYWDRMWNPIIGCAKVSRGCKYCWAESLVFRIGRNQKTAHAYRDALDGYGAWSGQSIAVSRSWSCTDYRIPSVVAVNWLGDLFHDNVYFGHREWIDHVFSEFERCHRHQFLVLTKRPHNMASYLNEKRWSPRPNVWLGTSVESQWVMDRVYWLHACPGQNKWISAEPLLTHVDVPFVSEHYDSKIAVVVAGAEQYSGGYAPPTQIFRYLRDQCEEHGSVFYIKTLGNQWSNRTLDGVEHNFLPWNEDGQAKYDPRGG